MPAAFPFLTMIGGSSETDGREIVHEYDDGTERVYKRSSFIHKTATFTFKSVSKTKRDAIDAFYRANRFVNVYVYVYPEASVADGTGAATTGRHTARIRGSLSETISGRCRFDLNLNFKLLD